MAARVISLSELKEEKEEFGKKINSLIQLINHGFEVAESFVITNQSYLSYLKENNLDNKIKHLVSTSLEHQIEKYLNDSILPKELVEEILKNYKKLGTVLDDMEITVNGEKIKGDSALIEKVKQIFAKNYPTKNLNIVVQKIHFGKHGKVRTSSKFINSIHPFSQDETRALEEMLRKFKEIFYIPHEIDFTLHKGKIFINTIKPETHVAFQGPDSPDINFKIINNSH